MTKIPLQPQDKYVLRLPDGMRDWLRDEADKSGRSMNAEIIYRLELTRTFDLDVGESAKVRADVGPVANYIDDKIGEVLLAIGDLKFQLEEKTRQNKNDDSKPF